MAYDGVLPNLGNFQNVGAGDCDNLIRIIMEQEELLSKQHDLLRLVLEELAQYKSVEAEERAVEKLAARETR